MLELRVRTAGRWRLDSLSRRPDPTRLRARFLCVALSEAPRQGERRICVGGRRLEHHRVGLVRVGPGGSAGAAELIRAEVERPSARALLVRLLPARAGLGPRRYRWSAVSQWSGPACPAPSPAAPPCSDRLPSSGWTRYRLRPVRVTGCTRVRARALYHGPRDSRKVALTFDDGPSDYTSAVLRILHRTRVRATFFVIGQEIGGREGLLREALRQHNEIANHTAHHSYSPGHADIRATSRLIERATGFRPCLFRQPGAGGPGAWTPSAVAAADRAGLVTIGWDVDPADWSTPGSGAIYSRVVGAARAGSIVLMHDGGGNRGQTVAALPDIIRTLRRRGYRLVTVTRLLGGRFIWRPYG